MEPELINKEEMKKAIIDLEVGYDDGASDKEFSFVMGYNQAIAEIVKAIDSMSTTSLDALLELKDRVESWWDKLYPEDIFDGSSGDEGAIGVVEIRELIKKIESEV